MFCVQWDRKAPEDQLSWQNNPNLPEQFIWLRCSSLKPYFLRNAQEQMYFNWDELLWHAAAAALLWVGPSYHMRGLGREMKEGRQALTSEEPTPGQLCAAGRMCTPMNRHMHVPGTPWSNPMQTPPSTRSSNSPSSCRAYWKKHWLIPLQRVSSSKSNGKWGYSLPSTTLLMLGD